MCPRLVVKTHLRNRKCFINARGSFSYTITYFQINTNNEALSGSVLGRIGN